MSDDGPGAREVAYRPFAAEFDDASLSYSESDEERAPNYVVTPTGARVNRLFAVGVLTEVERINDDTRRGRVVDPSGAFITYAGQYQPDAQAFLERADTPSFVALTGKARTFEPEDSDRVFTSVRPESVSEVDADTRDRWVVAAATATLDRLAVFRRAQNSELSGEQLQRALEAGGAPASLAAGIPRALDHYDTSPAYVEAIRRLAVDALELIAGEREEVRRPDVAPDEGGDVTVGPLPETDVRIDPSGVEPSGTEASGTEASGVEASDTAAGAGETGVETGEADVEAGEEGATTDVSDDTEQGDSVGLETQAGEAETTASDASPEAAATESGSASTERDSETPSGMDPAEPTGTDVGASDTRDQSDDLGDTEGGLGEYDDAEADAESVASDEMYELDDEEREEIESEFGTEFATGSEVDEPGEADIDVPDPEETAPEETAPEDPAPGDESADPTPTTETGATTEPETASTDAETTGPEAKSGTEATEPEASADAGTPEDLDLETVVVEAMDELDDGDGADRDAVIDDVVSEHGVTAADVEDAIDDALMGGKCYEPSDGVLKAI